MRVHRCHAERPIAARRLMPERDLPKQRVNICVLQERGEGMPPALGTGCLPETATNSDPDEGIANGGGLKSTRITPHGPCDFRFLAASGRFS